MTDMQCMLQKDDSETLLIAGHQDEIFELDLNRHKILKEVCYLRDCMFHYTLHNYGECNSTLRTVISQRMYSL